MNAIKNNPYRTLGLLGNSTEKELQRQIAVIKRFAEVGKTKVFDYDIEVFGDITRNSELVQQAASKIEQAKNKVHYALFWFLNNGHIDEVALNNLKEGNIEKAIDIWEKTLKDLEVTPKNFSAINNLSTLQLGTLLDNGSFDYEKFVSSLELKCKLLLSDVFNTFVTTVIGEGITINREIIFREFADEVLQITKPYLNKRNGIKAKQLIEAFNSFPNEIKQYVSGKFTDTPINNIENQIEIAKQKRIDNPNKADGYGEQLYINAKTDLTLLKGIWGVKNLQFQMIANKLVNEILQCAIDFFNELQGNSEYDPGESAMKVMKMAKSCNPTGQTKTRIDENIETVQEWINNSEERIIQKEVQEEYEFITSKLEHFQTLIESIENAKNLLKSCKPKLDVIKTTLGITHQVYVDLSSVIVQNAQNMLISAVNDKIDKLNFRTTLIGTFSPTFGGNYLTTDLKKTVKEALEVTFYIGSFVMYPDLKNHYTKNLETLKTLAKQFGLSTLSPIERIKKEIQGAESTLKRIQSEEFFENELRAAYVEMERIKEWHFLRTKSEKEQQIAEQQNKIKRVLQKRVKEKEERIRIEQNRISNLKAQLKEFTL